MVKIVQVIASRHPSFGGPSIVATALDAALTSVGADALLMSGAYGWGTEGAAVSDNSGVTESGHVYRASHPYRLKASSDLRKAIDREARDADLIHIHGQYLLPNVYAYRAARRHGVPFGIQPHGTLEPYQRSQSRWQKALYNALVGRRMLRDALFVHFTADSEAERAADVVAEPQVLVHPLGAALEAPSVPEVARDWVLPERGHVYLFLGRLAQKKRPDILVEAWGRAARHPEDVLVVAGPDQDFTRDALAARAAELGCAGSVMFTGAVTPAEATWLYERSGVFVLPSENENFAVAVVEAMLAGCAVVTTRQVAAHEYVVTSNGGVVLDEPSVVGLTQELQHLMDAPDVSAVMGARGAQFAALHLNWESLANAILERVDAG